MTGRQKKKSTSHKSGEKRPENSAASESEQLPRRAGMPAKDSIIAEKTLRSPKGKVYRILVTNEMDAYDKPERTRTKRRRKQ